MQASEVLGLREYVAAYLFGKQQVGQPELERLRSSPELYSVGDQETDSLSADVIDVLVRDAKSYRYEDLLVERVAERATIGYVVRDQGVQEFLASYPNVALLIWDNHVLVRQVFGDDATPVLDLLFDPDDGDKDFLYLRIETTLPPDVALDRLEQLDRVWNRTTSPLDDSRFVMDVAFR